MAKPKMTFTGLNKKDPKAVTDIEFDSWIQRPQKQRKIVEYTTRLGGSQLVISNIKSESTPSQVNAILTSNFATTAASITTLEIQIQQILDNIGRRFKFTDEGAATIDRCYVMDLDYNIRACDGGAKAMAIIKMTVMTDTPPVAAKK